MEHETVQHKPHHELQLLPSLDNLSQSQSQNTSPLSPHPSSSSYSLDLHLSITNRSASASATATATRNNAMKKYKSDDADDLSEAAAGTLKWDAAEQIRLAKMEKAYAERVREKAKKEMELAENEVARASHVWATAREAVGKAERLKEARLAVPEVEIICHCCRQRFVVRPAS